MKLTNWFRAAPETKSASPLIALTLGGRASWGARNYASLAREGVMRNAIAYRCVRMIAESASALPWLLYDGTTEIEAHPLLSLLARPNTDEDGTALFERWYAFLQCAGNAYLEALSIGGAVRELHVLRPDRVQAVKGARGRAYAYTYTVDGETATIPAASLLHAKLFHPLDDAYGFSPIEAASRAIDVHNAGGYWTKALLDNSARPSGALVYKGPENQPNLTDDQFRRLKRELEDAYQGSGNAGRPMVLEGGLDWKTMSYAPSDLDFAAGRDAAAREIALAFGVPPMLLGIPGDNTFSNYREANLSFWRQTVLPLAARTASQLTRFLGTRFGESLRLAVDADAVDALALERESVWERIGAAGFLTLNEKRQAAGYSPLEGGDVL